MMGQAGTDARLLLERTGSDLQAYSISATQPNALPQRTASRQPTSYPLRSSSTAFARHVGSATLATPVQLYAPSNTDPALYAQFPQHMLKPIETLPPVQQTQQPAFLGGGGSSAETYHQHFQSSLQQTYAQPLAPQLQQSLATPNSQSLQLLQPLDPLQPLQQSLQQQQQNHHHASSLYFPQHNIPAGATAVVPVAPGAAYPLHTVNYINVANPSPSFAHFTANITQMPNQIYYQPIMYHQPHPMPMHALAYGGLAYSGLGTQGIVGGSTFNAFGTSGIGGSSIGTGSIPGSAMGLVPTPASIPPTREWLEQGLSIAHDKYNAGDYTGAYNLLQTLYQANQAHLPTLLLLGCTCYSLNLHQLSIHYNNLILQLDPHFAEAFSNLGTTYRAMAQSGVSSTGSPSYNLNMAEQYYRIAISIRPKYWDASINLAGLLSAHGRYDEAILVYTAYERALEEEFEADERFDLMVDVARDGADDSDFVTLLTDIEKQRKVRITYVKASGASAPGEGSGWTDGRRRDLYYAKASLIYAMGDIVRAKYEFIKGLVAIGLDLVSVYSQASSGVLPLPTVTPAQSLVALQQQQQLKGLKMNLEYNNTASAILQTLAKIYQDIQQMALAVSFYYIALSICPNANTCNNIGILLAQQRLHEAISWYEFGLNLEQNHVHLLTNLGSALKDRGQVNEGIACYQRAISIQPDFFIALANLANVYKDLGRVEEGIDLYRRALKVKPDFIEAFCNYVNSLLFICDWEERDSNLKRIYQIVDQQLRDGRKQVPKLVPTVLPFHTFTYASLSAWMVREISRRNAERVLWNVLVSDWFPGFPERPVKRVPGLLDGRNSRKVSTVQPEAMKQTMHYPYPYPPPPPPSPHIRVGYLSSDFNNHPLAHLMQSVFGLHDRTRFRVYCYSLSPTDNSPYRAKIEREADVFLDVSSWSIKEIVERIALVDQIHILCNLNGYTKGGRNEVFAARPAVVQMQFMGFAGTMGAGPVYDPDNDKEGDIKGQSKIEELLDDGDDVNTIEEDDDEMFDNVKERWLDYLLTDEIASPRKFVCGEPLGADEKLPTDGTKLIHRGLVRQKDDANRIYTEGLVFMPNTYFVNDHRQGFRETDDAEIDDIVMGHGVSVKVENGKTGDVDEGYDSDDDLTEDERRRWRKEQIRRLKMRGELFPWLREDTVIFANFNQLYKVDPEIFATWMRIIKRVPNSILWLLRFPPAGEAYLRKKAVELVGETVAQRLIFTDVAPKHLHIHRGRIADVFLDTPECNAHTTAADILWSGTPVVTYPKYDFKMCSRVCASIAYATGRWSRSDLAGLEGGIETAEQARAGIRLEGVERLQDKWLLGHWMAVKSYQEYEDVAVRLGRGMKWGWKRVDAWRDHVRMANKRPVVKTTAESSAISSAPPSTNPRIPPRHVLAQPQTSQEHNRQDTRSQISHTTNSRQIPMSSSIAYVLNPTTVPCLPDTPPPHLAPATPFYPTRPTCTHIYTPLSRTLAIRLRRRLYLTRDECALFDTPRWVRGLEQAFEKSYARWAQAWARLERRRGVPSSTKRKQRATSRCLWIRDAPVYGGRTGDVNSIQTERM
ncbi:hypothetical protein SpCBS45565_g01190 [Spizellomyces sp. 'palustris']|nr:hypothetical protein SpCBS45565_g01190 [Spizellomyces sp. 'palustris']